MLVVGAVLAIAGFAGREIGGRKLPRCSTAPPQLSPAVTTTAGRRCLHQPLWTNSDLRTGIVKGRSSTGGGGRYGPKDVEERLERSSESRAEYLARVAAAHDAWVARHIDAAPFDPDSRPGSGDYNMWYLDLDADAAAEKELAESIGPVPAMFRDDLPETDEDADAADE